MTETTVAAAIVFLLACIVATNVWLLIVSYGNKTHLTQVYHATNSMKDELVEATRVAALAAGVLQGQTQEKARQHYENDSKAP
jgi:hypothetical protein